MKIASIAGVTSQTTNIEATQSFYEGLGCRVDKVSAEGISILVNWFWIRFQLVDAMKPSSVAVNMKVDSVEEFYKYVKDNSIDVITAPVDQSWGVRELTIADPDGNQVTLFEKK